MFLPASVLNRPAPASTSESTTPVERSGAAAPAHPTALVEIGIITAVFVAYKAVRFLVRNDVTSADANAREVIDFERSLSLFVEPRIQSWFLEWQPSIDVLNWFYARVHLASTAMVLLVLFFVDPSTYVWLRRRLVALTALALAVHVAYPLAPPRLVFSADMIDTLQRFGPAIYAQGSTLSQLANPYAAMPSLHFGYAVLIAWALIRSPIVPAGRWLFAHPFLMLVAIVATANHYWLDAMVCAMLIALVELGFNRYQHRTDALGMRHAG